MKTMIMSVMLGFCSAMSSIVALGGDNLERGALVGGAVPPLPSSEELALIGIGDGETIRSNFYAVVTLESRYRKYYSESERSRVGYQLLTNLVIRPFRQKGLCNGGYLQGCLAFPRLADDVDVMNLGIDMLGAKPLLPVSTNDVKRCISFTRIEGARAGSGFQSKTMTTPAYDHNRKVHGIHKVLYRVVGELVRRHEKNMTKDELFEFRTNVIERTRLLPDEIDDFFGK